MNEKKQIKDMGKEAIKIRNEFRRRYNHLAIKFNELCTEMDNFLTEMCVEDIDNEKEI